MHPVIEAGSKTDEGTGFAFQLEGWMGEALKRHPEADLEALARIPERWLRTECFSSIVDFRERGHVILPAMAEEARVAIDYGRRGIGGIRLAGAIWNRGVEYEIRNEVACFYTFVLSLIRPELSDYLASGGTVAEALRKAGWKP